MNEEKDTVEIKQQYVDSDGVNELMALKSNPDVALKLLEENGEIEYTPEEEKKLIRKIDRHMIFFMFFTYFWQFMDKNTLSNSAVFGLSEDLNLHGQQYSWAGSLFYFGYLVGQPIASRCFQLLPIPKYVAVCFVCWSIILVCTTATQNFAGLACIRFFLGVAEATVSPAWVILTSIWYKKDEQPLRVTSWYIGNAVGVIFGGLIAYGLGHIKSSIPPWKWFYVIYGIITFFWGWVLFFFLAESPATAKFLTDRERLIAVQRLRDNRTGIKNTTFKKEQAVEALLDPQVWLIVLLEFAGCLPAGGIQNFGNIIIKSFGFSAFDTVLINMPSGVIQGLTLIISGVVISKIPNSCCDMQSIAMIPCIIGTTLVKKLPNAPNSTRAGKMVAFWIQYSNTVADVGIFTLMTRNISGFTKKTVASSMIFIAYCVAMIAAPQFFKEDQAPGYKEGFNMMISGWVVSLVLPQILKYYYKYENKKRDKREEVSVENEEFLDLTDKVQHGFRYTL